MDVAVIGAGTMGSGIAQVCSAAGHEVSLCDAEPAQLDRAIRAVGESLSRFVRKDKVTAADAAAITGRIALGNDIAAAVGNSDVVIETVVEVLEVKHEVFREILAAAPPTALLGTNTSQLSITRVGSVLGDDATRLVGLHFFNPPVLMRLVEIVRGLLTTDDALQRAVAFASGLGKETVVCSKDSPGFLTSRVSAIVRLECLRMLEEGVASAADIDKALKLGLNFPMGPLELGDFNGLDTYLHACESLAIAHGDRFAPTVTLRNLVAAGRLGRKTGHGIYRYDASGQRIEEPES
jgi:3-hydroxybutyryl-CoA dehydrogenase